MTMAPCAAILGDHSWRRRRRPHQHDVGALEVVMVERLHLEDASPNETSVPTLREEASATTSLAGNGARRARSAFPARHCRSRRRRRLYTTSLNPFHGRDQGGRGSEHYCKTSRRKSGGSPRPIGPSASSNGALPPGHRRSPRRFRPEMEIVHLDMGEMRALSVSSDVGAADIHAERPERNWRATLSPAAAGQGGFRLRA